jgi:hypothetical protein
MNEVKFTLQNVRDRVSQRKPGYMEAVLAVATRSGDEFSLNREDHERIRRDFSYPVRIRVIRQPAVSAPTSIVRPGDVFSMVIFKITGVQSSKCGVCIRRVQQMNVWGWWRCWRNRSTIIGWLCEEAAKRKYPVTKASVMTLFKLAFSELRRKRGKR